MFPLTCWQQVQFSTLKEWRLKFHGQRRQKQRENCKPFCCIAFTFRSDVSSQVQWVLNTKVWGSAWMGKGGTAVKLGDDF